MQKVAKNEIERSQKVAKMATVNAGMPDVVTIIKYDPTFIAGTNVGQYLQCA
jgi:hypothetical protein